MKKPLLLSARSNKSHLTEGVALLKTYQLQKKKKILQEMWPNLLLINPTSQREWLYWKYTNYKKKKNTWKLIPTRKLPQKLVHLNNFILYRCSIAFIIRNFWLFSITLSAPLLLSMPSNKGPLKFQWLNKYPGCYLEDLQYGVVNSDS